MNHSDHQLGTMAEFNHEEKEAEAELNFSEDEMEQGIASPVDCWELVGSSPSSPLPEANGDVAALEEAMASACNSGSLLQDNYFGCAPSQADDEVLPVSTAMAGKQNDDDGRSSETSDALVSLDTDADAIENCTIHNDGMCHEEHTGNADLMDQHDGMPNDDHMHHNDTSNDGLPYCSNLMCYDDQVQHGVDVLDHCKMHDEFMMYDNELMEHDDRWHIEYETYLEGIMNTDGDRAHCINQAGNSCELVESMAVANVHDDVCALELSSGLESLSYAPVSSHGMGDSDMSMQQDPAEGSSPTVLSEEPGRETTQPQDFVDAQHSTINTNNRRHHKGFVCVSWIWTQLIRWQTQLRHANTIWSVALAAAVMGMLVLGRGWQRLQVQNQSLRSQLWAKEKRITQLMFQLMQTKDSLSKVRRVPVICVKPSLQIPQDNF